MMNRNIKYKQVCRLVLNGGDDLNKNVDSSQYSYNNNNIINSKRMIGCTRLRAVSGILRTQRGRRGSWLGRLLAGTAGAGPASCGRVPASSTPRVRLRRPGPAGQLFAATPAPVAQPHAAMPLAPVALLWPASGIAH